MSGADDINGAMSCDEMGREVMHSPWTEMAAEAVGGAMSFTGPGRGMTGALDSAGRGEIAHQWLPELAGAVTIIGCEPAEIGAEGGHAIGQTLHNLLSPLPVHESPPAAQPIFDAPVTHDAFAASMQAASGVSYSSHDAGSSHAGHDGGAGHGNGGEI
jgi:hypothetical protein